MPDYGIFNDKCGKYAVIVGRLSTEKGILPLCKAWDKVGIPLYVVGDGPLRDKLPKSKNITYFGQLSQQETLKIISNKFNIRRASPLE